MSLKKVFYGIDMGSPSEYGGFFCWREDAEGEQRSFEVKDWASCLQEIVQFYSDPGTQVYLAIEAPLWGKKVDGKWLPRFEIEIKGKTYSELAWYTNAGGVTGFMAQQFMAELNQLVPQSVSSKLNRIILFESYISGLKNDQFKLKKPNPLMGDQSHSVDAFETLCTLMNHVDANETFFPSLRAEMVELPPAQYTFEDSADFFAIGIINEIGRFVDFKKGEILFTRRTYGKPMPLKKSA